MHGNYSKSDARKLHHIDLLEFVSKGRHKLTLYLITPIKNDVVKRVDNSSQHDIVNNSIVHVQYAIKSKLVKNTITTTKSLTTEQAKG